MKLFNSNRNIIFLGAVLFLLPLSVFAQDNTARPGPLLPPLNYADFIQDFFTDHSASLYYLGFRQFYLGSEFSDVQIDGIFEDKYTNLLFLIPFGERKGIVIQFDEETVLDAFIFIYDPAGYELSHRITDKFILEDGNDVWSWSRLGHRSNVLNELGRMRFQLRDLEAINTYFTSIGIKIKDSTSHN